MKKHICVMPGDGIGPEIVEEALRVLNAAAKKFGHEFSTEEALIGGSAIDATGTPLPEATVEACKKADAVLLGAVGGPKWDTLDPAIRPEKGLLGIRNSAICVRQNCIRGWKHSVRCVLTLPQTALTSCVCAN